MAAVGITVTIFPVVGVTSMVLLICSVLALAAGNILADSKREKETRARIEEAALRYDTQIGLQRIGIDATLGTAGETQRQIGELTNSTRDGLDALVPIFDETVEMLAHEMNGFLWERRAMAPPIPVTLSPSVMSIDPNSPAAAEHDLVTCRQFFERFNTRLREDVDELAGRGFPDRELDEWSRNYLSRPQILDGIVGKLGELSRRSKLSRLK
jgi:hypothetical protein